MCEIGSLVIQTFYHCNKNSKSNIMLDVSLCRRSRFMNIIIGLVLGYIGLFGPVGKQINVKFTVNRFELLEGKHYYTNSHLLFNAYIGLLRRSPMVQLPLFNAVW